MVHRAKAARREAATGAGAVPRAAGATRLQNRMPGHKRENRFVGAATDHDERILAGDAVTYDGTDVVLVLIALLVLVIVRFKL